MEPIVVDGQLRKILPTKQHQATVIFSHGLGQYNATWAHVVLQALAPHLPHVLWILPQSLDRPVTFSQGQRRPAWFNVWRLPPHRNEYDEIGISESISLIENIILAQVHSGIDSRKIVLVGFSQGAALSLMVGLTTLHELGGVASLSGWIPYRIQEQIIHTGLHLPILWCHGTGDMEIPVSMGEDAISFLHNILGIPEEFLTYKRYEDLAHMINDAELDDLTSWLIQTLA